MLNPKQNNGLEAVPTCLESPESTPRTERVYHVAEIIIISDVGVYVRMYVLCSGIIASFVYSYNGTVLEVANSILVVC